MLPHTKAKELFHSDKQIRAKNLEYIENSIKKARSKYHRSWWLTVKSQFESLQIQEKNGNKA